MKRTLCPASLPGAVNSLLHKAEAVPPFFMQFLHAPTAVGSVCPSSKALTRALAAAVSPASKGLVIDLGAGSGVVSEGLLRKGIAKERIVAVEVSDGFRDIFARRCPGVPLVIGDARNLGSLLDSLRPGTEVAAILSSLPFRVMPTSMVESILQEVKRVTGERGGSFVQYSYAWWMRYPLQKYGFSPTWSRMVLRNVPPARVEAYDA